MSVSRRTIMAAGGTLAAAVAGGIVYEGWRLLRDRYPPTPYDDLLDRLNSREDARRIGLVFLGRHRNFTPATAARALRQRIGAHELSAALANEVALGGITEAACWIIPESLAGLCALAASV